AFGANTSSELHSVFTEIVELRPDAVLVVSSPFFLVRREDIVALAARVKCPVIYPFREFAESGGLLSHVANIPSAYRQAGNYVGRILKGTKPADLPVMQPVKLELVINLKAAKALGLEIPPTVLVIADDLFVLACGFYLERNRNHTACCRVGSLFEGLQTCPAISSISGSGDASCRTTKASSCGTERLRAMRR